MNDKQPCSDGWLDCSHNPNCHTPHPHESKEKVIFPCPKYEGAEVARHNPSCPNAENTHECKAGETCEEKMDWALECAQNIVEMTGYGQALHINDILPDIRGALTQAAKEAYERGVAEWYKDEEFERGRQAALKEVSVMMRDKPLTMVAASILATLKASKE